MGDSIYILSKHIIVKSNNGSKETSHTIKSICACVAIYMEWLNMVVYVVNGGNGNGGKNLILLLLLVNIPLFCRPLENFARLRKTMGYLSFSLSFF